MFDFLKSLTPDSIYEALILRQVKVAHVNEGRIRFVYDGLKKDDGIYRSICDALDAGRYDDMSGMTRSNPCYSFREVQ